MGLLNNIIPGKSDKDSGQPAPTNAKEVQENLKVEPKYEGLRPLVRSALMNDEISEKAIETLKKKAVSLGMDADEFEIFFNGLVAKKKKAGKKPLIGKGEVSYDKYFESNDFDNDFDSAFLTEEERLAKKSVVGDEKNPKKAGADVVLYSAEEIKTLIDTNKHLETDNVEAIFGKYEELCCFDTQRLSKEGKAKIHSAQLLYIGSIDPPRDKQELLDFIVNALLYARTSAAQSALKAVSKVGFTALKTVSIAGKVATLGIGSKAINSVENIANKAMTTDSLELINLWRQKIEVAFNYASKLEGGLFDKDKEFVARIKELKKQYESA